MSDCFCPDPYEGDDFSVSGPDAGLAYEPTMPADEAWSMSGPGVDDVSLATDDTWTMSGPGVDDVSLATDDTWAMSGPGVDDVTLATDDTWSMSGPGVDDVTLATDDTWAMSGPGVDNVPVATDDTWTMSGAGIEAARTAAPAVDPGGWTMTDTGIDVTPGAGNPWTMNAGSGTTSDDLVNELHGTPGVYVDPNSLTPGFRFGADGMVVMSDGLGPRHGTIDPLTAGALEAERHRDAALVTPSRTEFEEDRGRWIYPVEGDRGRWIYPNDDEYHKDAPDGVGNEFLG